MGTNYGIYVYIYIYMANTTSNYAKYDNYGDMITYLL